MNSIILIRNVDERIFIRTLLKDIQELACHGKAEEFGQELLRFDTLDFAILDERTGDLVPILEKIAAANFRRPPILLVLLKERAANDQEWASETDRVDRYSELGVELFLYRPSGLEQLKAKVLEGLAWAQKLPAWVELARAGRSLVKAKEYDRILKGLQTLHSLRPDDVAISLQYVRSLLNSRQGDATEAIAVLRKLRRNHSESVTQQKLLIQAYEQQKDPRSALLESLKLLTLSATAEHFAVTERFIAACAEHEKFSLWVQTLVILEDVVDRGVTQDFRRVAVTQVLHHAHTGPELSRALEWSSKNPDLYASLRPSLETLLTKLEVRAERPRGHAREIETLKTILLDAGEPSWPLLLDYVRECVKKGMVAKAEFQLGKAKQGLAPPWPVEYYACLFYIAVGRREILAAEHFLTLASHQTEGPTKALISSLRTALDEAKAEGESRKVA